MLTPIQYTDTALPTDSDTFVLFNSETWSTGRGNFLEHLGIQRWTLSLDHSHSGTIKGYRRKSGATAWTQFFDSGLIAAPTYTTDMDIFIGGKGEVKFEWVNGGTTQTGFVIHQALDTDRSPSASFSAGAKAQRPASPSDGQLYYDTSIQRLITYDGTNWRLPGGDLTGLLDAELDMPSIGFWEARDFVTIDPDYTLVQRVNDRKTWRANFPRIDGEPNSDASSPVQSLTSGAITFDGVNDLLRLGRNTGGFTIDDLIGSKHFVLVVRWEGNSCSFGTNVTPRFSLNEASFDYDSTLSLLSWTGSTAKQTLTVASDATDCFARRDGAELDRATQAVAALATGSMSLGFAGDGAGGSQFADMTVYGAWLFAGATPLSASAIAGIEAYAAEL